MAEGNLAIVSKGASVRKNKFAKAHEGMETREEEGTEKTIVMGRCRRETVEDELKVIPGERSFPLGGRAKTPHTASHGTGH
jgi:hypothetical protein